MPPTQPKPKPPASTYGLSRWLFLRFLGTVYLAAFSSLAVQIQGLIGSKGISPAADLLRDLSLKMGLARFYFHPTLVWLDSSDEFLLSLSLSGIVLSILLIIGFAPRLVLILMWMFYLSLVTVAPEFMGYQWEGLLLETGFLAIFFAPAHLLPSRPVREERASRLFLWLLLWLLFRLTFSSSWVKMLSGDPRWRDLIQLAYHYDTQPLPTSLGWYAYQLPAWFQKACVAGMFAVEPLAPFFIFLWREQRFKSFLAFTLLQLLVVISGNYSFFSLLTFALCLLLLDDHTLLRFLPAWILRPGRGKFSKKPGSHERRVALRKQVLTYVLAGVILAMSGVRMAELVTGSKQIPAPLAYLMKSAEPFRLVNNYGLFSISTNLRHEIIVEGSQDGLVWLPYDFKFKPGNLKTAPRFVAPHQPRLDWQMWFAALGSYEKIPWFRHFMQRLLEGSPDVVHLLRSTPFAKPPKYIRASLYFYHFTDIKTQREQGLWWTRQYDKPYSPTLTLDAHGVMEPITLPVIAGPLPLASQEPIRSEPK